MGAGCKRAMSWITMLSKTLKEQLQPQVMWKTLEKYLLGVYQFMNTASENNRFHDNKRSVLTQGKVKLCRIFKI